MKNKLTVTLLLLATMMTTGLFCSCKEKNDKEAYVGYLFAYFNGNAPWQEQICFALSADGYNYVTADFEEGMKLDVTGTSKGKGTQGNIKRHGHRRGPMSHGSKHKRLAGALAAGTYPSRVFKGNKAPGRMGRDTVTVQNVVLVKKLDDRNIMMIKGAVPGRKGGLLKIRPAVKGQDK